MLWNFHWRSHHGPNIDSFSIAYYFMGFKISTSSGLFHYSHMTMSNTHVTLIVLCVAVILLNLCPYSDCLHCEHQFVFKSNQGATPSSNRGYFSSPLWPDKYPENVRCRYRFVAQANQRVRIHFQHFNVEGLADDCVKDFLDIYIQVQEWEETLASENLLGRYCGHKLVSVPNTIISLGQGVVLDFFSGATTQMSYNQDDHMGGLGFNGTYEFISAAPYSVGQVISTSRSSNNNSPFSSSSSSSSDINSVANDPSYMLRYRTLLFDSEVASSAEVLSPTYPGLHPPNLNYTYIMQGRPGERVWIKFVDFDTHTTDVRNCPFDYIQLYDGNSTLAKPIQRRFCGSDELSLFSTEDKLTMEFITQSKDLYSNAKQAGVTVNELQRRGFKFVYTFSKAFIRVAPADRKIRVLGTECDMWVKSMGESEGYITTPGYLSTGLPPNKMCTYYFYGIHNKQTVELVELDFMEFNFPPASESRCKQGFVEQYSVDIRFDRTRSTERKLTIRAKPDRVLCGQLTTPLKLSSMNSVLMIKVNTTNAPAEGVKGFRVKYRFKKDFGIRGHMVSPGVCHFKYSSKDKNLETLMRQSDQTNSVNLASFSNSAATAKGFVNSPFYDRPYPNNMSCRYDFEIGPQEYVRLVFLAFKTKVTNVDDTSCTEDYLSVSEILQDERSGLLQKHNLFTFCGPNIPGPIMSHRDSTSLSLHFISDQKDSAAGFQALYEFLPRNKLTPCRSNVTFSTPKGGIIQSPNYPQAYSSNLNCEWILRTTGWRNSLILHFTDFEIEGSPQSCSLGVVNIYEESNIKPSSQLCGTASGIPAYIYNTSVVVIKFLTAQSSRGMKGFRAIWTEAMPTNTYGKCNSFTCKHSGLCIDQNLECNGMPNCGTYILKNVVHIDDSDETSNCPVPASYSLLHVGLGIILTVAFLIIIVVSILYRENRRSSKKLSDPLLDSQARKQLVSLDMLDLTYPPPPAANVSSFPFGVHDNMDHVSVSSRHPNFPSNQHSLNNDVIPHRLPLLNSPNAVATAANFSSSGSVSNAANSTIPYGNAGFAHPTNPTSSRTGTPALLSSAHSTTHFSPFALGDSSFPSSVVPYSASDSVSNTVPRTTTSNSSIKYANSYHSSHMASLLDGGEATLTREKMQKISIV